MISSDTASETNTYRKCSTGSSKETEKIVHCVKIDFYGIQVDLHEVISIDSHGYEIKNVFLLNKTGLPCNSFTSKNRTTNFAPSCSFHQGVF